MKIYDVSRLPSSITLGWDGENNWRPIAFDCSALLTGHPEAVVTLWLLPQGESQAFPVALERDGNTVVWTPLNEEMTAERGQLQIVAQDGTDVGKSKVIDYTVRDSLVGGADHPAETPSWATQVVADVTEQADRAEEAAESIGESIGEQLPGAIADYLEEHPVTVTEIDPTVPSWAKQPQKPTYTAAEVHALPDSTEIPTKTSDLQNDSGFLTQHQSLSAYRTASAQDAIDAAQDTAIAGKYTKPSTGIPKTDLAADVQTSLGKADTALQSSDLPYVTPQQYGAKGDGVHDDTKAIDDCFKYGGSNIYFPKGTYLVDAHHAGFGDETEGGLKPKSNSVITLDADATIKCSTSPTDFYNILHFVNVSNVIVQGGKIIGDKATHVQISQPTYEFGHGVAIQNSTNIVVRDMEICDCIGDGVILNVSGNADITLDNLTIHDCRRQGISLTSGDGIVISNCKIYDVSGTNPQSGIDIEPDGEEPDVEKSVTNVLIDGCTIHDTVGASVIVTNVSNVIDQIHITGCLLDHALFLGGSNVTMDGSKASKVSVKSEKAPMISACSIEEIGVSGGNSSFVGCNFTSSGKEQFLTITSDVVSGNPAKGIVFNGCDFNIVNCTHFVFMPSNAVSKVELLEFKGCSAKISHAVTGTYASSGFSNFLPLKTVISGSRFEFLSKIYQLFTAKPSSTVALEITDSEIVNSNEYRTNYLISGNATYDVWIEHSKLTYYGNMLYGGDATTGVIVLLNDRFPSFLHPDGKSQADNVVITNITRDNTKYLSGVRSNIQAQLDAKSDFSGSYNDLTDKPTIPDISGKADASDVSDLESRLNALADSDDTTLDQLSEIVAYIKNNKTLINNITTGKVSVSDIVDNLTSTATNKPLSANQGRALKALIDAIVVPTESTVAGWGFTKNTGTYSKPSGGIPDSDIASAATWNAKGTYSKPSGGIPASDMASAVQTSLGKADTALQSHQSLSGYATEQWVEGKGYLTQHQSLAAYRTASAQDTIDAGKANRADLATVATSGSYNDLDDKPSIPSMTGYATQTWVTQQGYLTLADLPIYNGGVS